MGSNHRLDNDFLNMDVSFLLLIADPEMKRTWPMCWMMVAPEATPEVTDLRKNGPFVQDEHLPVISRVPSLHLIFSHLSGWNNITPCIDERLRLEAESLSDLFQRDTMEVWLLQKGWEGFEISFWTTQQTSKLKHNKLQSSMQCTNHESWFLSKKNCSHGLSHIFPMVFPVTWTILPYLGRSPTWGGRLPIFRCGPKEATLQGDPLSSKRCEMSGFVHQARIMNHF